MAPKRLDDFIKIYDDVFSVSHCQSLINWFETSNYKLVDNQQKPRFYESTLSDDEIKKCISIITPYCKNYFTELDSTEWLPDRYTFEYARLKKYHKNSKDRFSKHVDVTDYPSARRFLSFLIYLNDVSSGGETKFIHSNKFIKPKTGRMIIFPPLWLFPHEGRPTYSNDKYILSTYLHYL